MRKKIGIGCIVSGMLCLCISVGFIVYNHMEEKNGQRYSRSMLDNVRQEIEENGAHNKNDNMTEPGQMSTVKIDGYDCIGVLSIPVLELDLPVLTDWTYEKLKKAPCLYYGSYYEEDFVIAAHNYKSHFGRLSQLQPDDIIMFRDADDRVYVYKVVLLETLTADATEEMITSGFDLSLYTCTPGGANRVTVRCNLIDTY